MSEANLVAVAEAIGRCLAALLPGAARASRFTVLFDDGIALEMYGALLRLTTFEGSEGSSAIPLIKPQANAAMFIAR